jgi:hypothetical protein
VKPLLVGEMPSRSGDRYWEFPLSGAVAQAMCQMAGIPPQSEGSRYGRWTWALYDRFDCGNAIERYQAWDVTAGASCLREGIQGDHEVVVLLGRRPQEAYVAMTEPAESPVDGADFYEWVVDPNSPTGRREVVVIPHPSSLNRMYNSDGNRRRAGEVLREAMDKAREMEETKL